MNQSFVLPNTSLVSMSFSQRDDHGFSPLHWACREGRSAVVEMLIMRGARINVMNRGDDTPLHLAASHGHRDIVQKVHANPLPSTSHTQYEASNRHCHVENVCYSFFLRAWTQVSHRN